MRYVSELFKEKLNEIIRPATRLHFEVSSNIINIDNALSRDYSSLPCFDTTAAPFVYQRDCTNGFYYSVLGDDSPVDDPNKICAPANPATMPDSPAPVGITAYTAANTEALIGDSNNTYGNFGSMLSPVTLCFKGLIPDSIRVEKYTILDGWTTETTIDNSDLKDEVTFTPSDYGFALYRFYVKNSTKAGRFQFLWLEHQTSETSGNGATIIFKDSRIANVSVDQETDLTSQTLPNYEMTVECLDVDGIYTPESAYWKNQFASGSPCYFKLGFEIAGATEYVPFMYGRLSQSPTYEAGKIKFKVSANVTFGANLELDSIPNNALSAGALVDGQKFKDIIDNANSFDTLFDSYNVFLDSADEDASVCNYYGVINGKEARQMIANALGCFITVGINRIDLLSANNIQYDSAKDTLTRYGQVKNTLESRSKVRDIKITQNNNTLSGDFVTVTAGAPRLLEAYSYVRLSFPVPNWALGKFVVTDYQKSVPSVNVSVNLSWFEEEIGDDGLTYARLEFVSNSNADTYIQPIVNFYQVKNEQLDVLDEVNSDFGEDYENNNELITCEHTAKKAIRVARLINDISDQYNVDVVQDFRYEVGDIIRLETEKNVFKTCVITALRFRLPGSSGSLTCRKIFSLLDSSVAEVDAIGVSVTFGSKKITIIKTDEAGCVVGRLTTSSTVYLYILGALRVRIEQGGVTSEQDYNGTLTDLNDHNWHFAYFTAANGTSVVTDATIVDVPDYDPFTGATESAYGAISTLKETYKDQGMNAPVDWNSAWVTT